MGKLLVLPLAVAACALYGGRPERLPAGHEPSRQRAMERDAEAKRARSQPPDPAPDAGLDAGSGQ